MDNLFLSMVYQIYDDYEQINNNSLYITPYLTINKNFIILLNDIFMKKIVNNMIGKDANSLNEEIYKTIAEFIINNEVISINKDKINQPFTKIKYKKIIV